MSTPREALISAAWCIADAGKKGDAMLHPALPSTPIRSSARLAGSAVIKQLKPKAAAALLSGSIEVDVNVQQLAGTVPQDFLGISLEWPGIEYYAGKGNAAAWSNVLGVLGPGAIIRVGGASQDKLTEVGSNCRMRHGMLSQPVPEQRTAVQSCQCRHVCSAKCMAPWRRQEAALYSISTHTC
jgi:hypothetical protein